MTCYHRNLTINDLVSNHGLGCQDFHYPYVLDHIVFYKGDKLLDILKTCYDNLDRIHLKVFHL